MRVLLSAQCGHCTNFSRDATTRGVPATQDGCDGSSMLVGAAPAWYPPTIHDGEAAVAAGREDGTWFCSSDDDA